MAVALQIGDRVSVETRAWGDGYARSMHGARYLTGRTLGTYPNALVLLATVSRRGQAAACGRGLNVGDRVSVQTCSMFSYRECCGLRMCHIGSLVGGGRARGSL